jgi:chromosome segregation ATPase
LINDPGEREKVLEKRTKNRMAASRSREKKTKKIKELETEKEQLETELRQIEFRTSELERTRNRLMIVWGEHEKICGKLVESHG